MQGLQQRQFLFEKFLILLKLFHFFLNLFDVFFYFLASFQEEFPWTIQTIS